MKKKFEICEVLGYNYPHDMHVELTHLKNVTHSREILQKNSKHSAFG